MRKKMEEGLTDLVLSHATTARAAAWKGSADAFNSINPTGPAQTGLSDR